MIDGWIEAAKNDERPTPKWGSGRERVTLTRERLAGHPTGVRTPRGESEADGSPCGAREAALY